MATPAASRELWLVGAGRMGSALLGGWIKSGLVSQAAPARVIEPAPPMSLAALEAGGLVVKVAPPFSPDETEKLMVLAVKPQTLDAALAGLRPLVGKGTALLSIVAGRTIASIAKGLGASAPTPAVIRSMPNTPAAIGEGITAAFASETADSALRALAGALLAAVGEVVWLDREDLLDAVTAVSGSGPAYVFNLVEALADAGAAIGLTRADAERLARSTIIGSAALLNSSTESPAALRQAVTSPGGTTEAALKILLGEKGLSSLMLRAVEAALARAKELGKG
jgi:pyrroline-5-carboxylate reductase